MGGTGGVNDGKKDMDLNMCWLACNADSTCKYWAFYNKDKDGKATGESYKIGDVSHTGV